jgi:hypothetical protein
MGLHSDRKQLNITESLELLGSFEFAARYTPWLRHLFSNIRAAVNAQLSRLSKNAYQGPAYSSLLAQVDTITDPDVRKHYLTFHQRQFAREVFQSTDRISLSREMLRDVALLLEATKHPPCWQTPLAHIVPRVPDFTAYGDSCLEGAGGYSLELKFWWHLNWQSDIRSRHSPAPGTIGDDTPTINTLEYATIIINFIISSLILARNPSISSHPHPTILLYSDNTSAISWSLKAANSTSHYAKSLSRLLSSYLIHSPIGISLDHISGEKNTISDRISRFSSASPACSQFSLLLQDYPQLHGCQRFHLPQEVLSLLTMALSNKSEPPELTGKIINQIRAGSNTSFGSSAPCT